MQRGGSSYSTRSSDTPSRNMITGSHEPVFFVATMRYAMPWKYKVIGMSEAVDKPNPWQMPWTKERLLGAAIQDCLNRMAEDGWDYVDSCPAGSELYFIFRSPIVSRPDAEPETGIKKTNRGQ
jgi:hypothetical protein